MVTRLTVTTRQTTDPLLASFINAPDEATSDHLLRQIIVEEAEPLISNIVRSRLQTSPIFSGTENEEGDVDDVCGEVILRLVKRLCKLKAEPDRDAIANLRAYVTTMAYNACDGYLRDKYPERHRLKNRLRYMVTHIKGLGLWETDDRRWVCGFTRWQGAQFNAPIGRTPDRLLSGIDDFKAQSILDADAATINPADLLIAIFSRVGAPVEFDDLVSIVAELWGIKDRPRHPDSEPDQRNLSAGSFDPRPDIEGGIDRRNQLRQVRSEICQLPVRQRAALLLNLRDQQGRGLLTLLPVAGIAGLRRIAEALEIDVERLLEMWDELPLEDSKIGRLLGSTPQQVVNLRKSARERLARRTKIL